MSRSIPVGLTNLYYAIVTSDDSSATAYDTPVRISGAITANFTPNASNDTIFADDGPYDTASTLGAMGLELNVADLEPAIRAELLGAIYDDATGILHHSAADIPPYVAVGMSVKKSNGADRLIWYLKGKFTAPDDNNQTKADSINWNTPTISGNFLKRESDNEWRVAIDTDDVNADATVVSSWFTSPNVDAVNKVAAVVADPVAGVLSKATDTEMTLTCATVGATIEYKLPGEPDWTEYTVGVATTAWPNGSFVVSVRAYMAGYTMYTGTIAYTVGA